MSHTTKAGAAKKLVAPTEQPGLWLSPSFMRKLRSRLKPVLNQHRATTAAAKSAD